ncbi:MAG: hypothetical protein Q4D66_05810, partial [Bacteroidales bacterium]|nr:hypothetical protein [Bacteroidales bacterium]
TCHYLTLWAESPDKHRGRDDRSGQKKGASGFAATGGETPAKRGGKICDADRNFYVGSKKSYVGRRIFYVRRRIFSFPCRILGEARRGCGLLFSVLLKRYQGRDMPVGCFFEGGQR